MTPPAIPEPSFWLELGFQALVAVMFTGLVVAVRFASGPRDARLCGVGAFFLLFVTGGLALHGELAFGPMPPPITLAVAVSVGLAVALAFTRVGAHLADALSFQWLVGFQAFRLPLELMMHEAHSQGVMPVQMSFAGYNFDILTGVGAFVVAVAYGQARLPRAALWVFNITGCVLLATIVVIAILSMPTALRAFDNEPPNVWITWWPFVWLPTFLVPLALLGHLLVFRKLARRPDDPGRVSTRRSSKP